MLDHLSVQVTDVETSLASYLSVFAPIGIHEAMRFPRGDTIVVGLSGPDGVPGFWLSPAVGSESRERHVGSCALERAAVDLVPDAAVGTGPEVLHVPRESPKYHPGYNCVLRDPDPPNVEAVHHGH